jgi:hypothetical protein
MSIGSVYNGQYFPNQIAPNFLGKVFKKVGKVIGKVVAGAAKVAVGTIAGGGGGGQTAPVSAGQPTIIQIQQPAVIAKTGFAKILSDYGILIIGGILAIIIIFVVMRK